MKQWWLRKLITVQSLAVWIGFGFVIGWERIDTTEWIGILWVTGVFVWPAITATALNYLNETPG